MHSESCSSTAVSYIGPIATTDLAIASTYGHSRLPKMEQDDNNSNTTATTGLGPTATVAAAPIRERYDHQLQRTSAEETSSTTRHNNDRGGNKSNQGNSNSTVEDIANNTSASTTTTPQVKRTALRRLSRAGTLFRPKTSFEPKIILEDASSGTSSSSNSSGTSLTRAATTGGTISVPTVVTSLSSGANVNSGTSLLSKLSRSTAPMRAKFSSISMNNLGASLRPESSVSLSIPLRRSAESIYNLAGSSVQRRATSHRRLCGERSQSFSFSNSSSRNSTSSTCRKSISNGSMPENLQKQQQIDTTNAVIGTNILSITKDTIPLVYPALLSKVAEAFKERITVGPRMKDSIEYQNAFDGREAVDKLAYIIKTTDRNLAVLLGRALDAQKFFHDVNYEYHLRDSKHELYQFQEHISPLKHDIPGSPLAANGEDDVAEDQSEANASTNMSHDGILPNGVFTVLTDCYSPTCTRERLCYSPSCPRRLEQARSTRGRHSRSGSNQSTLATERDDRLWINTVPQSTIDSLSKDEIRRQENIYELIYTEKDFVDDLQYLKSFWISPLLEDESIISEVEEERQAFVQQVFWNITDVYKVNAGLLQALLRRQAANPHVYQVGDVILKFVEKFEPFVKYGAHQVIGKYIFESEKTSNPAFAKFVQTTERLKHSRKLELNGYLTKPTTRLGRYSLLLREILRHTPQDHPDQTSIAKAMGIVSEFLNKVNKETGKIENKHSLHLLNQRLMMNKNGVDMASLALLDESRQLILKGSLKKKGSGSEASDVLVFLLDHYLIITKQKMVGSLEQHKLYRRPIPLKLLVLSVPEHTKHTSSIILPYSRSSKDSFNSVSSVDSMNFIIHPPSPGTSTSMTTTTAATVATTAKTGGYPISFSHLGRNGTSTSITLYATTMAIRRQWITKIQGQQQVINDSTRVLDLVPVNETFFNTFNRVHSVAVFDNGHSIAFGGDQGVYVKKGDSLVRILAIDKVSQIEVLEGAHRLILVLADKSFYTFSLDALLVDPVESSSSSSTNSSNDSARVVPESVTATDISGKRNSTNNLTSGGRRISSHVSFFKIGKIQDKSTRSADKVLVCFVRQNAITSTIRALEPYDAIDPKKKHPHIGRFIRGPNDTLKVYKDLYIPTVASSIQFFRNVICVGCSKGFQMVDPGTAEVQSVLDPSDPRHHVIMQRESLKPISMFRHEDGNILLCYNEIAFYIDRKGRRVREDWIINWEGSPVAFVYRFPYIIAFEPTFIEVRHVDTGDLVQVIPGTNIRCLRPDAQNTVHCVMDDRITGNEMIFELKFV